jgi:NAD(P)-dependent dehydrogenase (short-subunit alcohol dehydrogenase family)
MKTIVITGSNRGLGLELTRQLLERGERVFAACRKPDEAPGLDALKAQAGDRLIPLRLDAMDGASIEAAAKTVGGQTERVDWLINNAGIGVMSGLEEVDREAMLNAFEVNVVGPLMTTKAFLPLLGGNSVVAMMSSLIGSIEHKPELFKGGYPYSTSKAALNMVTRYMSLEQAERGLILAALSPGWVQTDMGGDQAPLQPPESIAGLIGVLDRLTPETSGRFWHYDGKELPW